MSRATAAWRYTCDIDGCPAEAFVADGKIPELWRGLAAASEGGFDGQQEPHIGIDLCPFHAGHSGQHYPRLPGTVNAALVGTVLILSHDLACWGCDWVIDQVLPATAGPARRSQVLAAAWLAHLDGPHRTRPVLPEPQEAACLIS